MKITDVNVMPDFKLHVVFDDGVSGVVNLKEFIGHGIFSVLKDEQLFKKAYTVGYSIAWNDELEIDAITVYAEILNKTPEEVLSNLTYATN